MRDSDIPRCLSVYHLHYPLSTKEAEDKIGENRNKWIVRGKMRILNLYKSIDNYLTGAAWGVKIQIHYHIYHYFTIYCSCVIYVVDHFQGGFFQCLRKS